MKEAVKNVLKGIYTAVVSPFDPQGELDIGAFKNLLLWQAESGVQGFVPCGTTGENPTLTRHEWRQLVSCSVDVAEQTGLSVIAGCGSNNTKEVIELISEAYELGADSALVVTPYYNKPGQRGLLAHYETIADKSPLPIVLYNVPGRTNVYLTIETIKILFQNKQIVGIKEASGNHAQWLQLACEVDLTSKALLAGDDDAFSTVLSLGGSGIISATANVAPHLFVKMYQAALEKRWETVFELQKNLLPLIRALFIETNPSPVKYALSLKGNIKNILRLPLVGITPENEIVVQKCLLDLGLL